MYLVKRLLFSSRVTRRFGVWLVSGNANVFVHVSVVTVLDPHDDDDGIHSCTHSTTHAAPVSQHVWPKQLFVEAYTQREQHHSHARHQQDTTIHDMTMKTENSFKKGAITLYRINFSTCMTCLYLVECLLLRLFSGRVRTRFSVWLVSGYARVFTLLSVITVTLPTQQDQMHIDRKN